MASGPAGPGFDGPGSDGPGSDGPGSDGAEPDGPGPDGAGPDEPGYDGGQRAADDDPLGLFSGQPSNNAADSRAAVPPIRPAGAGVLERPVRGGHRRHERLEPVAPARAVLGAAVAVSGVLLGVVSLLFVTDDPRPPVSAVQQPTARGSVPASPLVALPPAASTPAASALVAPVPGPTGVEPAPRGATPAPGSATSAPSTSSPGTPPAGSPATTPPAGSAAWKPPVTVLNATRTQGVARRAASRIRAKGWSVLAEDNWRGARIGEPTVFYSSTAQLEPARRLAQAAGATRVLPRIPGLPRSGLTLIVVSG